MKTTFTFECSQNNFMINNLNIVSFGDCFGSIVACMSFALLIELSRGINLYLRHYSVTQTHSHSRPSKPLSETTIRRRRFMLHILRTLVHLAQTALSYVLMLMVMNNFAGFILSAAIALGIGYYLLNGVHPYTRSANHAHSSDAHSDLTNQTDILNENDEHTRTRGSTTISAQQENLPINT